jgi:hypothetical protein
MYYLKMIKIHKSVTMFVVLVCEIWPLTLRKNVDTESIKKNTHTYERTEVPAARN